MMRWLFSRNHPKVHTDFYLFQNTLHITIIMITIKMHKCREWMEKWNVTESVATLSCWISRLLLLMLSQRERNKYMKQQSGNQSAKLTSTEQ